MPEFRLAPALGQDGKGALIWQTPPCDDWKAVMKRLAEIKIGMRRQFVFPKAAPDGQVHQRHWLSYPVTRHNVRDWDKVKLRLPNMLRFKVRSTGDGKMAGVIFHVPHLPPGDFHPHKPTITSVWHQVHDLLDGSAQRLTRSPE